MPAPAINGPISTPISDSDIIAAMTTQVVVTTPMKRGASVLTCVRSIINRVGASDGV